MINELSEQEVFAFPNRPTPFRPFVINQDACTGCNECIRACQADVMLPNPVVGKPPIIMYPDECFYGGCCVSNCPTPGAITFNVPLSARVRFKRKTTGKDSRVK